MLKLERRGKRAWWRGKYLPRSSRTQSRKVYTTLHMSVFGNDPCGQLCYNILHRWFERNSHIYSLYSWILQSWKRRVVRKLPAFPMLWWMWVHCNTDIINEWVGGEMRDNSPLQSLGGSRSMGLQILSSSQSCLQPVIHFRFKAITTIFWSLGRQSWCCFQVSDSDTEWLPRICLAQHFNSVLWD